MAIYYKSGEGRCPRPISYTDTLVYTRSELNEMRKLYQSMDNLNSALLGLVIEKTVGKIVEEIKGHEIFADIASTILSNKVEQYVSANSYSLTEFLCNNSGTVLNLHCTLRCVNKGQNGHAWYIAQIKSDAGAEIAGE